MSVQPQPWPQPAPEIVAAVAVMYRGKRERPLPVMVRDQLGEWLADEQFAGAYGVRGKPGWPPSRLALVTIFQMAEDLTDRQAAEAVRTRIDWKYALGLGLPDPGFDDSILSEFRARVAGGGLDQVVLDTLLERLAADGLVPAGGKMRTDSTHVIAAVRDLNRLELAGESVRACLEALAVAAPHWLARHLDDSWGKRYAARVDTWRMPASATKKEELALAYGRDGHTLLKAVYAAAASDPDLAFLARLHQAGVLRVVLVQNYLIVTGERGREVIKRREAEVEGLPPGRSRITSPYDLDARWGVKRDTFWNGYKVHVTETCDTSAIRDDDTATSSDSGSEGHGDDGEAAPPPHLIVNVETTDATVPGQPDDRADPCPPGRTGPAAGRALRRFGLPLGGAAGVLAGRIRYRAGHPDAGRHLTTGQGRCRVRPHRFCHRLRCPAGHLPARSRQQLLEPRHPARHRHHSDHFREGHLRALPGPGPVHHLGVRAPPAHPPSP